MMRAKGARHVPTEQDIYLFREGTHCRLHQALGCHVLDGGAGAAFSVWAPNAAAVSVIGDWNGWGAASDTLTATPGWIRDMGGNRGGGAARTSLQVSHYLALRQLRDGQGRPAGGVLRNPARERLLAFGRSSRDWGDTEWMAVRGARNGLQAPMAIYEVHIGSWRRKDGQFLSYRELAQQLADYVSDMGFTHVEMMPVTEHPF